MPEPERILALQLKRIGDAILTAPALAAARARAETGGGRRAVELTLVLAGPAGGLGPAFAAADEVLVYRRHRANLDVWARVIGGGFDRCYDFTGTDRSALLTRLSGADERVGFQKFSGSGARGRAFNRLCGASVRNSHTVDFQRALVGEVSASLIAGTGFRPPRGNPDLMTMIGGGDCGHAPFSIVHPGTARTEKYWFASRWAKVIEDLHDRHGLQVVITGSADPEEQAHLASLKRACRAPLTDLSGRLTLLELASVIARARVVMAVDSAATHLAAMEGVAQIALFGPTNPFHWRPRHPEAVVLRAGCGEPLGETDFAPRSPGAAMRDLSTDTVIRAIGGLLSRTAGPR